MNYFCSLSSRVSHPLAKFRLGWLLAFCCMLQACATDALRYAPQRADQPWRENGDELAQSKPQDFSVVPNPALSHLHRGPELQEGHVYTLYELIDIAQRENPSTRLAWNRARQAALARGAVEATFLPMLSARVISGWNRHRTPVPMLFGEQMDIDTRLDGVIPALALEWLVFDFGQRRALARGAEHVSYAANVLFNAAHQKVIRDVTHAYYHYAASRERARLAEQAKTNVEGVARAVQERYRAGISTSVEAALAKQHVAQANLRQITAQGIELNAYQSVLAASGLPGNSQLILSEHMHQPLDGTSDQLAQSAIEQALTQRPDILAAYASLQAAHADAAAARAEFAPKVVLAAVAARNRTQLGVNNLPDIDRRSYSSSVMLGVNVPIFDGGLRAARLKDAQIHVAKSADMLQKLQQDAVREIVGMHASLRSALAAYQAASELVQATEVTYDAAFEAYQHGVGTLTLTLEASTALLDAQLARSDAHAAALTAAADLAFLMGELTSATRLGQARG